MLGLALAVVVGVALIFGAVARVIIWWLDVIKERKEVASLKASLQAFRETMDRKNDRLEEMDEELGRAERQATEFRERADNAEADLVLVREENAALQSRKIEMEADMEAALDKMAVERESSMKRLDEFVDVSNREMVRLNGEVAELRQENERLKDKLSSVDDAAEILRERWEALQKENDALKAELAEPDLRDEVAELRAKNAELNGEIGELRKGNEALRRELEITKQRHGEIIDALEPIRLAMGWMDDEEEV